MSRLILVVGMGGSGKTHYCRARAEQERALSYSDFTLAKMDKDDERAGIGKWPEVVARLLRGTNVVANEPHLTNPDFQTAFRRFLAENIPSDVEVEWVFFKKDLRACAANVINDRSGRQSSRAESLLNQFSVYTPPDGGQQECYQPDGPIYQTDDEARQALEDVIAAQRTCGTCGKPLD